MQHVLSETINNVHVESVVFPAYEVRIHLVIAALGLADYVVYYFADQGRTSAHSCYEPASV